MKRLFETVTVLFMQLFAAIFVAWLNSKQDEYDQWKGE